MNIAWAKGLEKIAGALKESPDFLNYPYITKIFPNGSVMLVPSNSLFLLAFPTYGPAAPQSSDSGSPGFAVVIGTSRLRLVPMTTANPIDPRFKG